MYKNEVEEISGYQNSQTIRVTIMKRFRSRIFQFLFPIFPKESSR